MRSVLFQLAYWATSVVAGVLALPLLVLPGRTLLMGLMRLYSQAMVFWMRTIGGIGLDVRGRGKVPDSACIIAAKHQSWGDGYSMFSQFHDLAFVTGDHLEKLPMVRHILRKMQAIVIASCGGPEVRARLMGEELDKARQQGRRILIYPEGQLVEPGYHAPYKKGVFHMYEAYDCPVVPVATNLGLFWTKRSWQLKPGTAVLEFLEPILPGLGKDEFMTILQERIERASLALLPPGYPIPEQRIVEPA